MVDQQDWRLRVELARVGDSERPLSHADDADAMVRMDVRQAVPRGVAVTGEGGLLFVYASSKDEITAARDRIAAVLRDIHCAATLGLARWDSEAAVWEPLDAPLVTTSDVDTLYTQALKQRAAAAAVRETRRPDVSESRTWSARVASKAWFAVALVCAAAGATWYALSPGVVSYQALFFLTLPAFVVVLVWLGRRLPGWIQWTLATGIAVVGPLGYLLEGGSQWWAWGQAAVVPLVVLIAIRVMSRNDEWTSEPWYGGPTDGPWGPP